MCFTNKQKPNKAIAPTNSSCQIHGSPLDFICVQTADRHLPVKICIGCQNERKHDKFISVQEFKQKLQMQRSLEMVDELKLKLLPFFNETEQIRQKLIDTVNQIHESLLESVEEIFTSFTLSQKPPNCFNYRDVFQLISNHTLDQFVSTIELQSSYLNKLDEPTLYLLTKMLFYENESKSLIDSLNKEQLGIKSKLEKSLAEYVEINSMIRKSIEQVKIQSTKKIQIDPKDKSLFFMTEAGSYNQAAFGQDKQLIGDIKQNKKLKLKIENENSNQEMLDQQQIKSIVSINENYVAYCTNQRKIIILDVKNDFNKVFTIDSEYDLTALGKIEISNTLLISNEVTESQYQIQFWSITQMEKLKVINAHEKYIWNIIELPNSLIATCSDDCTIKIFDGNTLVQMNIIALHQASVNDISLINQDILISVSDDGTVMASEYKTGNFVGAQNQEHEIKCVCSLDGQRFVTGNNAGEVIIYAFGKEITLFKKLSLHQNIVRFLSRVSPKIFVTSSWDGQNMFVSIEGEIMKKIEIQKQYYNEPILWVRSGKCFLASVKGQLVLYS